MYEENNPYSQYDANGQTPQELLARLLTLQNRIASTVTSVGEAQSSIEQNAEQILLRVEKNGVISAINQSPEEISILASRINLVGAVTVLSDITGDLGTITAGTINGITLNGITINGGNINVMSDLYVGNNIYLAYAQTGAKEVRFSDFSYFKFFNDQISFHATTLDIKPTTYFEFNPLVKDSGGTYQTVATQAWVQSNAVAKFG